MCCARLFLITHIHTHSINIYTAYLLTFTETRTHTPLALTSITHTLTTYCLASKAYVGRPKVLFISSL